MWKRSGLGPVFAFETLLNTRRRQVYQGRSLYVLMVLVGLIVVWSNNENANLTRGSRASIYQEMAKLGELTIKTFDYRMGRMPESRLPTHTRESTVQQELVPDAIE